MQDRGGLGCGGESHANNIRRTSKTKPMMLASKAPTNRIHVRCSFHQRISTRSPSCSDVFVAHHRSHPSRDIRHSGPSDAAQVA